MMGGACWERRLEFCLGSLHTRVKCDMDMVMAV